MEQQKIHLEIDVHNELHYAFSQFNTGQRISNPMSQYVEDFLRANKEGDLILFRGNTDNSVPLKITEQSYLEIAPYAPMPINQTSPIQLAINHIKNYQPEKNSVFVSSSILPATCAYISAKNMRLNKYFPLQIMVMNPAEKENQSCMTAAEVLMSVQSGGPSTMTSSVLGQFNNPSQSFTSDMPSYLWAESQGEVMLSKGARVRSLGELHFLEAKNNDNKSVTMTWEWHPSKLVTEEVRKKVEKHISYWNQITTTVLNKMKDKCGIDFYSCELEDFGVRGETFKRQL